MHRLEQIAAARKRLHVVAARAQERIEIENELLIVIDQRQFRGRH
jgi:hypothetical protein